MDAKTSLSCPNKKRGRLTDVATLRWLKAKPRVGATSLTSAENKDENQVTLAELVIVMVMVINVGVELKTTHCILPAFT
jgi:hypothetical protein